MFNKTPQFYFWDNVVIFFWIIAQITNLNHILLTQVKSKILNTKLFLRSPSSYYSAQIIININVKICHEITPIGCQLGENNVHEHNICYILRHLSSCNTTTITKDQITIHISNLVKISKTYLWIETSLDAIVLSLKN